VLKLTAQDTEDLKVISAHMQDALVRLSDIRYLSKTRQFALVASRFAWEQQPNSERRRTGVHFEHVLNVKQQGILGLKGDTILSLLAISFEPELDPSGTVVLTFSADCTIRLGVEYLDLQLKDLGGAWATELTPNHGD
jgi:Flp pilus assembly CpaE family ATPase